MRQKKSLWSTEVTLRNDGNSGIRKDDFDNGAPVRVIVNNAQIVDRPTLMASNAYLVENARAVSAGGYIEVSPVIMEPGDAISISFLILGADNARPDIRISGKIAGVRSINLMSADSPEDDRSIFRQVIGGASSIWIQIIRAPVYFFLFVSMLAVIALTGALVTAPIDALKSRRERDRRAEKIREIRLGNAFDQRMNALADEYVEHGFPSIYQVSRRLSGVARRVRVKDFIDKFADEKLAAELKGIVGADFTEEGVRVLARLKLIKGDGNEVIDIPMLEESLEKFCAAMGMTRADLAKEDS
ncbi:hypothetical protein [Burkholderia ubonensis]|uniref:hypothetical protein n=1 Tax=Burkholderia ubonensis TaxID=101571 RepID=UPI0018DF8421|nr:hypothetical protein [Burkholderia ubonensis]